MYWNERFTLHKTHHKKLDFVEKVGELQLQLSEAQ